MEISLNIDLGGITNRRSISYSREVSGYGIPDNDEELDKALQQLELGAAYLRSQIEAMRAPQNKAALKTFTEYNGNWYNPPSTVDSGPVSLTTIRNANDS